MGIKSVPTHLTNNAVLTLRAKRLARSTRPFLARGNRVIRCQRCLLPEKNCLCRLITTAQSRHRFCLIMFDTEPLKPSNTGRLIADVLPDTLAFSWSRTDPDPALLAAVADTNYHAVIVFPESYAEPHRTVIHQPPAANKPLLFIILDGTWNEARKMFRKSPWLNQYPLLSLDVSTASQYRLREASQPQQHCTVEVAAALLAAAGDSQAAEILEQHFIQFRQRYLAGKSSHRVTTTRQNPD